MTEEQPQSTRPAGSARAPRRLSRVAFVLSTVALLTATHWPGLAIQGPIDRTDLVIHVVVFAVWAGLLARAIPLRLPVLVVIGVAFAVFDETTQPFFNRTFDELDLIADAVGVVLGAITGRKSLTNSKSLGVKKG